MANTKGTGAPAAIVKRASSHVKKLQAARVAGEKDVPAAADKTLQAVARFATELQRARALEEPPEIRQKTLPCQKYNTWWDAFKTLVGAESEWEACMCRNYNAFCKGSAQ